MLCVAFEVCAVILPLNEGFIFLCSLDWVFPSLSISSSMLAVGMIVLMYREKFPSYLIQVEGVFWLFTLKVIT